MNTPTLEQVLSHAEKLSRDDQEILTDLLKKRRIEAWRNETAAEANKAFKARRAGKLKAETAEDVIRRLRTAVERET